MNFSIAQIIARLWSPRHEISCSWFLWQRLCAGLRERGRNATRESGAFLLAGFTEEEIQRLINSARKSAAY